MHADNTGGDERRSREKIGQEALADWFSIKNGVRELDLKYVPKEALSLPKWLSTVLFKALRLGALIPVQENIEPPDTSLEPWEIAKRFTDKGLANMGITIEADGQPLDSVPKDGPLIVVSNHPFGGLDGMALMSALLPVRKDMRVLVNTALGIFPDLRPACYPLDILSSSSSAVAGNVVSLRMAQAHLDGGGCLAFFPGGTVSHWRKGKGIVDPEWQMTVARFARKTGAAVLPVFFHGRNTILFNLLGLIHARMRTILLPREMLKKSGSAIRLTVGRPIDPTTLKLLGTPEAMTAYMRMRCYALQDASLSSGGDLPPRDMEPVAAPHEPEKVARAFAELPDDALLLREDDWCVYTIRGGQHPFLLEELGSLREATFRLVGEGSGKARDLDIYDDKYHHLLLWHAKDKRLVGAYRLGKVQEILGEQGQAGLYTTTLFKMNDEFFRRFGNALELGRAVIHPQYQREYSPLLLLWKGIGRFLTRHEDVHCLFGPVSLSLDYAPASLRAAAEYLREQCGSAELANLVKGRKLPDRMLRSKKADMPLPDNINYNGLVALIRDIEGGRGIPILFKHYLKLGGKIGAFHLDTAFNTLDAFLLMDLVDSPKNMLQRYMSPEGAEAFLERWQGKNRPRRPGDSSCNDDDTRKTISRMTLPG